MCFEVDANSNGRLQYAAFIVLFVIHADSLMDGICPEVDSDGTLLLHFFSTQPPEILQLDVRLGKIFNFSLVTTLCICSV